MNRSPWAKSGILAALSCFGLMHGQAYAADGDSLSLKIEQALRGHMFMRASVLAVKVKTKSGDTYDVTGPVMTREELGRVLQTGASATNSTVMREFLYSQGGYATQLSAASAANRLNRTSDGAGQLLTAMDDQGVTALGTPAGIKGEAKKSMATAGFSLGYYLDDDFRWAVETFVLAAPLSTSVTAHGKPTWRQDPDAEGGYSLRPNGLEGQKIISSKLLPPTLMFGRYWGIEGTRFQPYTGLMAMYAIFYDTKASEALNSYVGGSTPGSTTVSLKNTFGAGPMVGFKYEFNDTWHVGLSVGSVRLKTVATITTRNTLFTKDSGAIQDFGLAADVDTANYTGKVVADTIVLGEKLELTPALLPVVQRNGGLTSLVSKAVAYSRGQSDLGTYVRKTEATLDSTILMMSVGYKF